MRFKMPAVFGKGCCGTGQLKRCGQHESLADAGDQGFAWVPGLAAVGPFPVAGRQHAAELAGADGIMVGGYLTTGGRTVVDDLRMIEDAGFEVLGNPTYHVERGGRDGESGILEPESSKPS